MSVAAGSGEGAREQHLRLLRANRLLITLLVLAVAIALVDRVGQRVWAIAVFDSDRQSFVEYAYLAQRAQAEVALERLLERFRDATPIYRDHPDVFARANAGFQEPVVKRRVRRLTCLAKEPEAADAPIQRAVEVLARAVNVTVDGYGIYVDSNPQPLVVLPDEAWAQQARDTRLANCADRVKDDLDGIGMLFEQPEFVQKVEIRPVIGWPIKQVKSVADAVRFLTVGDLHEALHTVQAGEEQKLGRIAARYDATTDDLIKWNAGRDLTLLKVGDQVIVRRPEPPVVVKTVEHRYTEVTGRVDGRARRFKVTVEIIRHDGEEVHRNELTREVIE